MERITIAFPPDLLSVVDDYVASGAAPSREVAIIDGRSGSASLAIDLSR